MHAPQPLLCRIMPFPRASKSTPALDRSIANTINATYQNKTAVARMWSTASTAPLFNKKIIRKAGAPKPANGRKPGKYRVNRALSAHTIKALASGAAANASALIQKEAVMLRCDTSAESHKYPILPCVTKSAAMLFEQAVIAYAQSLFQAGTEIKNSFPKRHKKVTQRCAQASCDSVNAAIAQATSFVPASIQAKVPDFAKLQSTKKEKREKQKAAAAEVAAPAKE